MEGNEQCGSSYDGTVCVTAKDAYSKLQSQINVIVNENNRCTLLTKPVASVRANNYNYANGAWPLLAGQL